MPVNAITFSEDLTIDFTSKANNVVQLKNGYNIFKKTYETLNPFELYGGSIAFSVFRNGKKIGSHDVNFKGKPESFTVKAECRLAVNLLFFTAYKFEYLSVAQWSEGALNSLDVSTTVNGIKSSVIARSENNELSITGKNGKSRVKPPIFPTDHWHFGVVNENIVINTLTGDLNKVVILRKNQERLTCGSRSFLAQRYSYTGDLKTDVWYDQEKRWVGMQFEGSDGSFVDYKLREKRS